MPNKKGNGVKPQSKKHTNNNSVVAIENNLSAAAVASSASGEAVEVEKFFVNNRDLSANQILKNFIVLFKQLDVSSPDVEQLKKLMTFLSISLSRKDYQAVDQSLVLESLSFFQRFKEIAKNPLMPGFSGVISSLVKSFLGNNSSGDLVSLVLVLDRVGFAFDDENKNVFNDLQKKVKEFLSNKDYTDLNPQQRVHFLLHCRNLAVGAGVSVLEDIKSHIDWIVDYVIKNQNFLPFSPIVANAAIDLISYAELVSGSVLNDGKKALKILDKKRKNSPVSLNDLRGIHRDIFKVLKSRLTRGNDEEWSHILSFDSSTSFDLQGGEFSVMTEYPVVYNGVELRKTDIALLYRGEVIYLAECDGSVHYGVKGGKVNGKTASRNQLYHSLFNGKYVVFSEELESGEKEKKIEEIASTISVVIDKAIKKESSKEKEEEKVEMAAKAKAEVKVVAEDKEPEEEIGVVAEAKAEDIKKRLQEEFKELVLSSRLRDIEQYLNFDERFIASLFDMKVGEYSNALEYLLANLKDDGSADQDLIDAINLLYFYGFSCDLSKYKEKIAKFVELEYLNTVERKEEKATVVTEESNKKYLAIANNIFDPQRPETIRFVLSALKKCDLSAEYVGANSDFIELVYKLGLANFGQDNLLYKRLSSDKDSFELALTFTKLVRRDLDQLSNLDNIAPDKIKYFALNARLELGGKEYTPLILAVLSKRNDLVEKLLQPGPEESNSEYILKVVNAANKQELTPLMLAASGGSAEIAKLILERLSDKDLLPVVNKKDSRGFTSLMIAILKGNTEIAKLILERLSKENFLTVVNMKNIQGTTPLMIAIGKGNTEIAKLILDKLSDEDLPPVVNAKNDLELTPLMIAIDAKNDEIAGLMLSRLMNYEYFVAAVNERGHEGLTPLILCADIGNVEIAELIVNRLNYKDFLFAVNASYKQGWTSFLYSAEKSDAKIAKLILDKLHDKDLLSVVNFENEQGWTPLLVAINARNTEVVELILNRLSGENLLTVVNKKNRRGLTPLMFANEKEIIGIVGLISAHIQRNVPESGEGESNVQIPGSNPELSQKSATPVDGSRVRLEVITSRASGYRQENSQNLR